MMGQRYSDAEMLAEIRRVAQGKSLSRPAYQRAGDISASAINIRFGSWSAALAAAGVASPYAYGGIWFDCPVCGTKFRSDNGTKAKRTCSTACGKELKRRKLWKGDAASKQAARGRSRRVVKVEACARCGFTGSPKNRLEVHHRDRDPYNNAPANLQVLCHDCHVVEHRADRS